MTYQNHYDDSYHFIFIPIINSVLINRIKLRITDNKKTAEISRSLNAWNGEDIVMPEVQLN